VEHADTMKEAEIRSGIAHAIRHLVNRHPRIELRVGPAEIHDELAAPLPKY
jgi:hypothetical protein